MMDIDYRELCPVGTNVRIICPKGSGHEGWTVMPVMRDKSQMFIPEGYELVDGVGSVTGYELEGFGKNAVPEEHRLNYDNLVIVQHVIQCSLNIDWWLKESEGTCSE